MRLCRYRDKQHRYAWTDKGRHGVKEYTYAIRSAFEGREWSGVFDSCANGRGGLWLERTMKGNVTGSRIVLICSTEF